ncbi:leucine rich repeat domain-containing protein [Ditylenchus destructor]|nr:leucine rich repeat domain-containing protein [Ditylenchus destructor]
MKFLCIPNGLFACKSGMVETLDYSQLRLEELPKEIFKARKHVEELLLNVNGIEDLPQDLFRCLKLRRLDVSENKIKVLPGEIGVLQALAELNLSKNEFVEIPDEIGECRSLMSLNISTNIVPGLPKSIVNLSQLSNLNVSNNSLTQLPTDIDLLSNLAYLDASQCELRFLPPSIVKLSKLRVLDLCENYLTELPSGLDGLSSIEILDLANNMVGSLPDDILKCQSLRTLDLSSNNLTSLPNNLGDLTNLAELTVCDNQIGSIPNSIGRLKKLEILKVAKNRIAELTPAICSCSLLTDLILCDNQLNELPSSVGNLKKLRFLDVNVNKLQYLPTTIGSCSSLGVLTLRHNQLREIPMEIGKLEQLQVLDLIDNNLTYLPFTLTVLYNYKTFSALWLSFNQPSLPKLSATHEPVTNIKVLTCYLLPQKGDQPAMPKPSNKSCVVGTRVSFGKEWAEEDEENKIPIGRFERYDTPHPKPFAPKNRLSRNSGDFTNLVDSIIPHAIKEETIPGSASDGPSAAEPPMQVETRPLRSVLKRRPQSVISQISTQGQTETESQPSTKIVVQRGVNGFGWHIVGGTDSIPYKGRMGVFISQLNDGGMAAQAGFHMDDRIVAVSNIELANLTHAQVVEAIKLAGDELEVLIERNVPPASQNFENDEDKEMTDGVFSHKYLNGLNASLPSIDRASPASHNQEVDQRRAQSSTTVGLPEIISVTVTCRSGDRGSPGFAISGSGLINDPVVISSLTVGGPAYRTGKLQFGDRLLSVNGVNVKNATHDQVVTLLTANSIGSDIYLVVERCSPTQTTKSKEDDLSNVSLPNVGAKDDTGNFKLPPNFGGSALGALSLSKSLPSLAAPPVPPPRDLNQRHRRAPPLVGGQSMNSLFVAVETSQTHKASNARFNVMSPSTSHRNERQETPEPIPRADYRNMIERFSTDPTMQPLATSSPIPKAANGPTASQIPMPSSASALITTTASYANRPPPPVAPKPKLEEIHAQKKAPIKTLPNGAEHNGRPSGIPMKKPLVSSQDLEKLKAEEENRRLRGLQNAQQLAENSSVNNEREEEEDAFLELSNDACFNQLLRNGSTLQPNSTSPRNGPAVVRTRNAEIRAEKAAARAANNSGDISPPSSNAPVPPQALPDETSFGSRASSSLSTLEQKAVDLEKRQAWRQARLQSMDVESKRTDEVIKLITSIPSSPIPMVQ